MGYNTLLDWYSLAGVFLTVFQALFQWLVRVLPDTPSRLASKVCVMRYMGAVCIVAWGAFTALYARHASGSPKYPFFPFAGEISYRCFGGCQKYFWRPLKAAYEIFPTKLHLANLGPPEARVAQARRALHRPPRAQVVAPA